MCFRRCFKQRKQVWLVEKNMKPTNHIGREHVLLRLFCSFAHLQQKQHSITLNELFRALYCPLICENYMEDFKHMGKTLRSNWLKYKNWSIAFQAKKGIICQLQSLQSCSQDQLLNVNRSSDDLVTEGCGEVDAYIIGMTNTSSLESESQARAVAQPTRIQRRATYQHNKAAVR